MWEGPWLLVISNPLGKEQMSLGGGGSGEKDEELRGKPQLYQRTHNTDRARAGKVLARELQRPKLPKFTDHTKCVK